MDEIVFFYADLSLFIPIIVSITGVTYFILILSFYRGWKKLPEFNGSGTRKASLKLSVIVPFRDEKKSILSLIEDLDKQDLEKDLFDVVLVDDHSADGSYELGLDIIQSLPNFKLIRNRGEGKKEAVLCGIENSIGELIITTDADCRRDYSWLSVMHEFYIQESPRMIIGPVLPETGDGFFQKLQALEFISLIGSTAGAAGIKRPLMCNGANLVYERKVIQDLNDPLALSQTSGDDIFLLLALKKISNEKIYFLKSTSAAVYTSMSKTLREFWLQRIRWVSKSKSYRDKDVLFTAFLVWLMNFVFLALIPASIVFRNYLYMFVFLILLKWIPDYILLKSLTKYYGRKDLMRWFFPLSVVYPFYVVLTGFWGLFGKSHQWKGRKF